MNVSILLATFIIFFAVANDKVGQFSKQFIGKPYLLGALGEGDGYDSNPRFRNDKFDCTTFVETVVAMSMQKNGENLTEILDSIRYKYGIVQFVNRNHFTSVDWIPNNEKAGFVKDITIDLYPTKAKRSDTFIDRKAWFKNVHGKDVDVPLEKSDLPYIEGAELLSNQSLMDKIPTGSIVTFVAPSRKIKAKIGTDYDVSHQGFLVRKSDGKLYLRHASPWYKEVVDEPFEVFLDGFTKRNKDGGINLLEVIQN